MPEATCLDLSCPTTPKVQQGNRGNFRILAATKARKRVPLSVFAEMAMLRLGAGRLSAREYLELKLYEDLYTASDKRAFVGLAASRQIWFGANYRVDLFAMANNKVASAIWFAAHGFPILPTKALYHEGVGRSSARLLQSESELRSFLKDNQNYPLFGKPVCSCQSVGSASIETYVESLDSLITTAGRLISLDNFVSYVKSHAKSSYQFQSRISPHAAIRQVCGDRLATVRLLTVLRDGKPQIVRGCWKIPAGAHAADNFWRPGNLLAQLDLESGRVLRVLRAAQTDYEEIAHHPDTQRPVLGMAVPNWEEVKQLALDGARLLDELPLIGWDIAPIDSGAVLVEPNVTPDFRMHQLADRRGILDDEFVDFLRQRKRDSVKFLRAGRRKDFRETLKLLGSMALKSVRALPCLRVRG